MSLAKVSSFGEHREDLSELIDFLRSTKNISFSEAQGIAEKFGYPVEFITEIISALRLNSSRQPTAQIFWRAVAGTWSQIYDKCKKIWVASTANPVWFVLSTGATGYLLTFALVSLLPKNDQNYFGFVIALTFVLHQLCFARHGMLRYPLYSAVAVVVATLIANMGRSDLVQSLGKAGIIFGAVTTGVLYSVLGGLAALLGGMIRASRRDVWIQKLSRQEALDRLFFLNESLSKLGKNVGSGTRKSNILTEYQGGRQWVLISFLAGIIVGSVRVLVLGGYQHVFPGAMARDPIFMLLQVFSIIVTCASFLAIGFATGTIKRAIASQFVAYFGYVVTSLIRLGGFGPDALLSQIRFPYLVNVTFLLLCSGLIAGFGAKVEDSARRERRRANNDPASMIAEAVILERALQADRAQSCVVSVDVARSTAMKTDQDPLVVEWSFREYHNLLAECATSVGGQVLSTSGDGAILTFSNCLDAVVAAKDVQTRMSWFNLRVNRLDSPFRLRIGIHSDEVQGDLNDVQFTHVIDIAAHIQNHAPVGGILISQTVASQITDEPLTELKDPVEGEPVFLVNNPTFGA